jgi:regulatory protein
VPVVALGQSSVAGLGSARLVTSHYSLMVKGICRCSWPARRSWRGTAVARKIGAMSMPAGAVDDEVERGKPSRANASSLPASSSTGSPVHAPTDPSRREASLLEVVPRDRRKVYRIRPIVEACVDRGSFFEIGKMWGRSVVTGLARLDGWPVAVLASDPFFYGGGWTTDASHKVIRFVDFAETFHLPVVHFVDIPGFVIGVASEKAATIQHGARAMAAIYQSKAPWCSILMRKSFGVAGAAPGNWQIQFPLCVAVGRLGLAAARRRHRSGLQGRARRLAQSGRPPCRHRGAAQQGALAVPHRRALRGRGDHRPARHAPAPVRVRQPRRAHAQARPAELRLQALKTGAGKRTARPITAKYLQNAATFYLERYPSTAEGLRRVLNRRVRKARMLEAPVMDNVKEAIETVVAKFVDAGVIDDKAFAQTKARALHRRGTSTRLTRQKLKVAGVAGDTLDQAMVALDEELHTDPRQREARAAAALARRRRLGPFRPAKDRKDFRARDLAAMARAGFAYDVAKKVIDAASPDALDDG